jgi:signal transduction histidine kinase
MFLDMRHVRDYLLPDAAEQDARFHRELQQRSQRGLRVLGLVEVAIALWILLAPRTAAGPGLIQTAILLLVGAATSLLGWMTGVRRFVRTSTLVSAWLAGAVLSASAYSSIEISVLILTAVALVALQPRQTFGLGLALELGYLAISRVAPSQPAPQYIFLAILTVLGTAISAELYAQRRADYEAGQKEARDAEVLASAQSRALLAEGAVAIGRFAAALTHEINSPLGTLKSSIETLLALAARQVTAPADERDHLAKMQAKLGESIQASCHRLQDVVDRLHRFINLSEAELKDADLNQLISDVAIMFEERVQGEVRLELDLTPLPTLQCRPQLLSTAFSHLLSNAIAAADGNGHVCVSTRRVNSHVEIRIEDNGRGMPPEEVEGMFDPTFKVSGERVRSSNWSLFNSRQIVFEHGGDIHAYSVVGKGTTISITLPCNVC